MPAGRPTDYREEYCDSVIEWAREGKSRAWMAAQMEISRQTMLNWEHAHPEFLDATTRAAMIAQAWWEDAGQDGMVSDKFNGSVWAKSMAARFPEDWRDKSETAHTGPNGGPVQVQDMADVALMEEARKLGIDPATFGITEK